jgi:hypothetical protein
VTLRDRFQRLVDSVRSYRIALKASGKYGRSIKLRRMGRSREALEVARQGLLLLSDPVVRRQEGPEGSGVVCLTLQVERLAHELGEPGAGERDLADAVAFLRSMPALAKGQVAETSEIGYPTSRPASVALWEAVVGEMPQNIRLETDLRTCSLCSPALSAQPSRLYCYLNLWGGFNDG